MLRVSIEEQDDGPYYIWIRDDDYLPDIDIRYYITDPDTAWDLILGLLDYLEDYYYDRGSDEALSLVRRIRDLVPGGGADEGSGGD